MAARTTFLIHIGPTDFSMFMSREISSESLIITYKLKVFEAETHVLAKSNLVLARVTLRVLSERCHLVRVDFLILKQTC